MSPQTCSRGLVDSYACDDNRRTAKQPTHRPFSIVLGVIGLLVGACTGPGAGSGTTSSTTASPSQTAVVLCHSVHFSLVAVTQPDATTSELLFTTDFLHFSNITPPLSTVNGGLGMFDSAACLSSTDFWLISASADSTPGWLLHTTNGGLNWSVNRQLWVGNGGSGTVSFADSTHGWFAAGAAGDNSIVYMRTIDGGKTWTFLPTVRLTLNNFQEMAPQFVTASIGFAATSEVSPWSPNRINSELLKSVDGGATWSQTKVGQPTTRGADQLLYGAPAVFETQTVIPVLVVQSLNSKGLNARSPSSVRVNIVIERSDNAGRSWSSTLSTRVGTESKLGNPGSYGINTLVGAPSVSLASYSVSWIAYSDSQGHAHVLRSSKSARSWFLARSEGLPQLSIAADVRQDVAEPVSVAAISGSIALLSVVTSPFKTPGTYITYDGGLRWQPFANG
jgi:hypothetical protein